MTAPIFPIPGKWETGNVLHAADLVLLTALLTLDEPERASFSKLAGHLQSSTSTVHRAMTRLDAARLVRRTRKGSLTPADYVIDRSATHEVLVHAIRYFMPATLGLPHAGMATAHAGPDLAPRIRASEPYVWPTPEGDVYGPTVEPLDPCVPPLALRFPSFYRVMALIDACRVGRVRERALADEMLRDLLMKEIPWKTP